MTDRTRLPESDIERMAALHPGLPATYFNYLRDFGWGHSPSGHMVYSGPISPSEVYPQLSEDKCQVLLGDDMQGFCFAYDFRSGRFGEFSDAGEWSSFGEGFALVEYLTGRDCGA